MSDKQKTLGDILKSVREKAGFAQGELAGKMGYSSPQFVSNWERNLCSLPARKAPLFCKLTGFSPNSLLELLVKEERRKIEKSFGLKLGMSKKKAPAKKKTKPAAAAPEATAKTETA